MREQGEKRKQKVVVFQQSGSGEKKIVGIRKYAATTIDLTVIDIDDNLPPILEASDEYLPATIDADLVLDYCSHPDLSHDLVALCTRQGITVVSSGKKIPGQTVLTPPTCCGLARYDNLGAYGAQFGAPEYEVEVHEGVIVDITVVRGAPCAASWEAARRLIGTSIDDAARRMGIEAQFFCHANPAGWDPIYGKSPVHFAGKVHGKALAEAIAKAGRNEV